MKTVEQLSYETAQAREKSLFNTIVNARMQRDSMLTRKKFHQNWVNNGLDVERNQKEIDYIEKDVSILETEIERLYNKLAETQEEVNRLEAKIAS